MYKGRSREDTKPHIFSMADEAFRNLVDEGQNQSILVTGESGAGKTENTKKVIQYLAAVATSDTPRAAKASQRQMTNLSEQILRANPILEAFGNAQTVRNNNSSRFGKFIRIEFTRSGQIAGAYIDWYLLEKSRVVHLNSHERNYHVFYQLLRGADRRMKENFLLTDKDIEDFEYTRQGNDTITGVSDRDEWNSLIEAFHVMNFTEKEQASILRTVAAVLHLGNISVMKESLRADQAMFDYEAEQQCRIVCKLLGIPAEPFIEALLHPRVKAGYEWVQKAQTPEQVRLSIDALSKGIYERQFGDLVTRINRQLDRSSGASEETHFIGVLDIAGFEIFEENSFEQLCINFTNEKLQQFFNHHMFVLEQEEYAREQIQWNFIDFGKDLQPTIDLIELSNPIGIFSCLDEDSVMPKATDKSFTEKLHGLWERKTPKYRRSLLHNGFMLTHYAAEVEYSTNGWLEKNKDPLNDNVTRLLAASSDKHFAELFADCAETDDMGSGRSRVKKGLFRTVAQRHKEQLSTLMGQLHSTHPHFVRCILPNHKKRPKQFHAPLVLDQLRCNGVLEGIRIARTGFPNRLLFAEFRSRYEVLCPDMPTGYLEGQVAAKIILERLNMDRAIYRVGLTKVFFRAGVLAELEERRDALISEIMARFQSVARGFVQRRIAHKRLYRAEATRIIQHNFRVYLDLQANPWWRLFVRMKPLLGATRQAAEMKKRDDTIRAMEAKVQAEAEDRLRVEEERRRAETEIHKIQQTLESERALALDKDEIFRRLQEREAELSEKLAASIEDQEKVEEELDIMVLAKRKTDDHAEVLRKELEQAGEVIDQLESEKKDLLQQIDDVEQQLEDMENAKSRRTEAEEQLEQEVRMLNSQLSLKDRKLHDLEAKLLKNDQDLDIKLAAATKELGTSRTQIKELVDENRQIRQQLTELSSTSTSFEDLVRRKDSELVILKTDMKKYESDRKLFESEKRTLASKHDGLQSRLREAQGEMEAIRSQNTKLQREAADAKRALEERVSEAQGRKMLEKQIDDLKAELFTIQKELTREQQSKADQQLLGEHKHEQLQRDYHALNESKITIEKEMYAQEDIVRRQTEGRKQAEDKAKEYQAELRALREKYLLAQEEKIEAQSIAEGNVARAANERNAAMRKEIDARDRQLNDVEAERDRLADQVQGLTKMMAESDSYQLHHDKDKERLERELVTVKGRLTASENDNRALLNKIQQKNLDIARSNSKAGDSQRSRLTQLTTEKSKLEEENKKLLRQVQDTQITITSLEKQKEKLALNLEDLNHEMSREHKTTRNAEATASTINLQLTELNRKLEAERQLRAQAQTNSKAIQSTLDDRERELAECYDQLKLLRKVFEPDLLNGALTASPSRPNMSKHIDLAKRIEAKDQALRVANERCARVEAQLEDIRNRHSDEMSELDMRHTNSRRNLLEEMNQSQVNTRQQSPIPFRGTPKDFENRKPFNTPPPLTHRHISNATDDSARSDRTVDTIAHISQMDQQAEIDLLQNQLQMSNMRVTHLENQIRLSPSKRDDVEDSPSNRRMEKLARENTRLHHMLDDSTMEKSALQRQLQTGNLTMQEIKAQRPEELLNLINSQEQSRKDLLQSHKHHIAELAEAKTHYDDIRTAKASADVELRDAKSELQDLQYEREQESANHAQLLQEFADLQIRLDGETSKLVDVQASLSTYKSRTDEYYSKLEQAEIAVLKATRAEQFAKSQAKEAEEQCASIMAERKTMDASLEDVQRACQRYEERIEDLAADLEGALQAKKRLQNELEDYRSQRAMDIEDKETGHEQMRKKYQGELANVSTELERERESVIVARQENGRLRDEIEELRGKWDDEVLNSSTWSKEKSRLEMTLQDLVHSRDEAVNAHHEAQGRVVELLSQVRSLRSSVDDVAGERDALAREKKSLEARLSEASGKLEDLARSESPAMRNAASRDKDVLELKANLARKEDIAAAAVGKMRRAEALAQETQKDIATERESNNQLHKDKAELEKKVKDLQLRLVDLETKGYSSASQDVRFLHGRIQEVYNSHYTRRALAC